MKPEIKTTLEIIKQPYMEEYYNYEELLYAAETEDEEIRIHNLIREWKKEHNKKWVALDSLGEYLKECIEEVENAGYENPKDYGYWQALTNLYEKLFEKGGEQ